MTDDAPERSSPTDDIPERPSPTDDIPERPPASNLASALKLRRNLALGAVAGLALAVLAYLFRVLELGGPFRGTRQFPILGTEGWFLLLAFVLATATAFLVTVALTVVTAYRLSQTVDLE